MSLFSNFVSQLSSDILYDTDNNVNSYIADVVKLAAGRRQATNLTDVTQVSAVYTSARILSETLSKLPLEIYQEDETGAKVKDKNNYLYPFLHYNPNSYTTQQSFVSTLELSRNLTGNAIALINRNRSTGKIEGFQYIPTTWVKDYFLINNTLYYKIVIKVLGEDGKYKEDTIYPSSQEIFHFKSMSKDGVWGVNPISAIRNNYKIIHEGKETIYNHYENNLSSTKVIKSTVNLKNADEMNQIVKDWKDKYTGSRGEMILPLPPNTDLIDIKLPFSDAQFVETIKWSTLDIGAVYGVPSFMFNDTAASKYNDIEQMTLAFKTNTIQPISKMYRQEMESKLLSTSARLKGKSIEFNLDSMVEADLAAKTDHYVKMIQNGVYKPNFVAKLQKVETYPEGENHIIPSNMMFVEGGAGLTPEERKLRLDKKLKENE